jgi:hypothetical protein
MSTPKRRRSITYTDEAGNEYTDTWMVSARGASLGSIPRELHLVDAYCQRGHLAAVLMTSGDGPPLVMVHGQTVPVPMLALTSDGLVAVMVFDSGRQVGTLGTPRESFPVDCPMCWNIEYILDAGALSERLAKGENLMRLRRGDAA